MGVLLSALDQAFPPKPKFSAGNIPDLKGKVMLVTGGNSGIGKETVKALYTHNAKVYMASRSETKANEAIEEVRSHCNLRSPSGEEDLEEVIKGEGVFLPLDLANLKSVQEAARIFLSLESELHVLFNNAGIGPTPLVHGLTDDGYDIAMGANVLGHFYLTSLLMPALLKGAKSSGDGKARVINTSSLTHFMCGGLDFNTFRDGPARRWLNRHQKYSHSKFANIVFSNELARRYGDQGIVSTSLNPGNLRTNIHRNSPWWQRAFVKLIFHDASKYGALTQLWAGTSPETKNMNGKYLIPWARIGTPKSSTEDRNAGEELWRWMEEQVKDVRSY